MRVMYPEIASMSKPLSLRTAGFCPFFVLSLLLAVFLCSAGAQNNPSPAEAPQQQRVPGTGITIQNQPSPTPQQPKAAPPPSTPVQQESESEKPITKAQAKELFRSVDEILKFAS